MKKSFCLILMPFLVQANLATCQINTKELLSLLERKTSDRDYFLKSRNFNLDSCFNNYSYPYEDFSCRYYLIDDYNTEKVSSIWLTFHEVENKLGILKNELYVYTSSTFLISNFERNLRENRFKEKKIETNDKRGTTYYGEIYDIDVYQKKSDPQWWVLNLKNCSRLQNKWVNLDARNRNNKYINEVNSYTRNKIDSIATLFSKLQIAVISQQKLDTKAKKEIISNKEVVQNYKKHLEAATELFSNYIDSVTKRYDDSLTALGESGPIMRLGPQPLDYIYIDPLYASLYGDYPWGFDDEETKFGMELYYRRLIQDLNIRIGKRQYLLKKNVPLLVFKPFYNSYYGAIYMLKIFTSDEELYFACPEKYLYPNSIDDIRKEWKSF